MKDHQVSTNQNNQTGLVKNQAVSEYLTTLSTKLPAEEVNLILKKYEATRIELMQDAELLINVAECLKRIHVITGWNLPDDSSYIKILTEELFAKLKESFFMLNFQEITFAFRKNGIGIKDWGKNMNLDLVCNVLANYSEDRRLASLEEEKINNKPVQRILSDKDLLNISRRDIEIAYQQMRKGMVPIMYESFAQTLLDDGIIEKVEDRDQYFIYCLGIGQTNIYVKE